MSMVDSMLEGDEAIVKMFAEELGPLSADQFVCDFNNACSQLAGFEHVYPLLAMVPTVFLAPIHNLSRCEH